MGIKWSLLVQALCSEQKTESPLSSPPCKIGPACPMDVTCFPLTQVSGSQQRTKRPHLPPPGGVCPASQMDVACSPLTQASGSEQRSETPHFSCFSDVSHILLPVLLVSNAHRRYTIYCFIDKAVTSIICATATQSHLQIQFSLHNQTT